MIVREALQTHATFAIFFSPKKKKLWSVSLGRHVKFWYLEYSRSKYKEPVPLMGRSAILGEQRNNYFCDVACGRGEMGDSTYAITKSGLLCEFNNRRLLDKWVELRVSSDENFSCHLQIHYLSGLSRTVCVCVCTLNERSFFTPASLGRGVASSSSNSSSSKRGTLCLSSFISTARCN